MLPGSEDQPRDVPLSTRIKRFISSIPLYTKVLFFTCIVVYIIQWITGLEFQGGPEYFGIGYYRLVYTYEFWRIFTHSYFHLSILHILFNMLALSSLGIHLERIMGTLNLFLTTVCLQILNSGFYVLIIFLLNITGLSSISVVWGMTPETLIYGVGCGLSGELFSYMIFSCHFNPSTRMCFGRLAIPAKIYPWLMLLVASFLFPSASFLGHLAGLLGGYVFVWFFLNRRYWNFFISKVDKIVPARCYAVSGYVSHESAIERVDDEESVVGRSISWIRDRVSRNRDNEPDTNPDPNAEQLPTAFPGSGNVLGSSGGPAVLPPPPPVVRTNYTLPPTSGSPNEQVVRDGNVYDVLDQMDLDEEAQKKEENLKKDDDI